MPGSAPTACCAGRSTSPRTSRTCSRCSPATSSTTRSSRWATRPRSRCAPRRPGVASPWPTSPTATTSASSPTATPSGSWRRGGHRSGRGPPRRRVRLHRRPAPRAPPGTAGPRRPPTVRAVHHTGDEHGDRRPRRSAGGLDRPRWTSGVDGRRAAGGRPGLHGAAACARRAGTGHGHRARQRADSAAAPARHRDRRRPGGGRLPPRPGRRHRARVRDHHRHRRRGYGVGVTYPWPAGAATGIGSLPGTDFAEAVKIVFGEVPDFPHLPELPARGRCSDMIGRGAGLLVDLPVEIYAGRWRVTARPGRDARVTRDLLERDLDAVTEHAAEYTGPLKVASAGPWTLASSVQLPVGGALLRDPGAVRDLAASLGSGEHTS